MTPQTPQRGPWLLVSPSTVESSICRNLNRAFELLPGREKGPLWDHREMIGAMLYEPRVRPTTERDEEFCSTFQLWNWWRGAHGRQISGCSRDQHRDENFTTFSPDSTVTIDCDYPRPIREHACPAVSGGCQSGSLHPHLHGSPVRMAVRFDG